MKGPPTTHLLALHEGQAATSDTGMGDGGAMFGRTLSTEADGGVPSLVRNGGARAVRTVPKWLTEAESDVADVFARNGYEGARMEEIAVAAGVPRATLYYHFKGKDEVLAWLLGSTLDALGEAVGVAASGRGTARQRLERVVRAQLRVMGERPGACRMLIADLERAGRMPDIARGVGAAFLLPVSRLLEEGKTDGSLRAVRDSQRMATAVFGAVTIPALSSLVVDESFQADSVARVSIDLILRGLAPG